MASSKVNNTGNSNADNAPNTYEMAVGENNNYQYETVQSEASAPAQTTNALQPSAPPPRSSQHDTTLIDNDLYE